MSESARVQAAKTSKLEALARECLRGINKDFLPRGRADSLIGNESYGGSLSLALRLSRSFWDAGAAGRVLAECS